jgi:serine protease
MHPLKITAIESGLPVTDLNSSAGSYQFFSIAVPTGVNALDITTKDGSGDADLYVRKGALPTLSNYDCSSDSGGTEEVCSFTSPSADTWYILLYRYDPYSGVTLSVNMN